MSMRLNENVSSIIAGSKWGKVTLVEAAQTDAFFTMADDRFAAILEAEQIDEGVKEIIQKARAMAAKLPADLKQAAQVVAQKTGKALDATNTAYVRAQGLIDKIPLIGRIPQNTRNRLILGLALSFAAGMNNDASAGEMPTDHGAGHHDTGAAQGGDHQATGGNEGGGQGGEHPAPQPKVFQADLSGQDVRAEMAQLRKGLGTLDQKIYSDQFIQTKMQTMLMAAKKAGTVQDPNERQQLIDMAKSMAKGIITRIEPDQQEAASPILAKAIGAAFRAGKGGG